MKNYYRVMLGQSTSMRSSASPGTVIGADFGIAEDLSAELPDECA